MPAKKSTSKPAKEVKSEKKATDKKVEAASKEPKPRRFRRIVVKPFRVGAGQHQRGPIAMLQQAIKPRRRLRIGWV